jgi:hypothetical protein
MKYFSCLYKIIASEIINPLNRGDATLKNIIKLAELFSTYLLILLNKYRGLINIPKVTGKMCLGTTTISTN